MTQLVLESDQFYQTQCGQTVFVIECAHKTPRMFMARLDKVLILFQEDGTRWPTHRHHGSDLVGKKDPTPVDTDMSGDLDHDELVRLFYQTQPTDPKWQHLKTLLSDFSKFIFSKGYLHE